MGKLVIYLADGKTLDVPLDRERITIGRRPDNDVCLPFPAVSGEHAQVVTILADSFLEDLGSTNGTLVNGKPIVKHFLRDRDAIDIGRQRLTYLADVTAKPDALPPDMVLRQAKGIPERVAAVRPTPRPAVTVGMRTGPLRPEPIAADLDAALAGHLAATNVAPVPVSVSSTPPPAPQPPAASEPSAATPRPTVAASASPAAAPAPTAAAAAVPAGPSVRVLSGASRGRTVAFRGPDLTVGRVGVQVAVVRRLDAGGYLLIPLEGKDPLRINGAAVAPEGSPLHPGDTFEVAGVRLELAAHP
ncbi:MAG: FHA domain-containing protein [Burkholderiales bacterium]|nr:FHA domain-containing protein [Burkholderiales bacterium]